MKVEISISCRIFQFFKFLLKTYTERVNVSIPNYDTRKNNLIRELKHSYIEHEIFKVVLCRILNEVYR